MNRLLLCAGTLTLLYAGLSMNVSRLRLRKRKLGRVTQAELAKAIRAHGNAAEYVPLFVGLFLYFGTTTPDAYLSAVAAFATFSRMLHAAGMFRIASVDDRHPLRFCGALGTYVCLFLLGWAVLRNGL